MYYPLGMNREQAIQCGRLEAWELERKRVTDLETRKACTAEYSAAKANLMEISAQYRAQHGAALAALQECKTRLADVKREYAAALAAAMKDSNGLKAQLDAAKARYKAAIDALAALPK